MQKSRSTAEVDSVDQPQARHLIVSHLYANRRPDPIAAAVRFHAIGYFPRSVGHHRTRPQGAPEWVVMAVVAGRGWSELDGRRRHHRPLDLVVLPRDQPHAYGADPADPWSIAWAHVAGTAVSLHRAPQRLSSERLLRVTELIDEAYAVLNRPQQSEDLRLASGIAAHLVGLLNRPQRVDDGLSIVLRQMRADPAAAVDLPTLARRSGRSVSQFLVHFRAATGTTPIDWLTGERIALACRLLARSDTPIEQIAHHCGYQRGNTFTRAFRQRMGLSPSVYRRAGPPG